MRHECPRHPEHARIALQVSRGKLGQLTVVTCRQIVLDFAELLIDDMEVIDQPLSRRRNLMLFLNRAGDRPIGIQQHSAVVHDPRNKRAAPARFFRDGLCCRKALGVLLEPFQTEQFGAYRLLQVRQEKGKTQLNNSDYLELISFDTLCGALFCRTSTRWRPVSGIETFPPSTISLAVILRP